MMRIEHEPPRRPRLPRFDGRSPGRYLRMCRERLGLELAALHERTRIRHHFLASLEAERFDALPSDLHLREYARQFAQALGVVEPERLAQRVVECAQARRSGAPVAAEPFALPSAEDLLALFDDEPELDDLVPASDRRR